MKFIAVLEHRLRPGRQAAYLDAVRASSAVMGHAEGRGTLAVAFADTDPLHALSWASWSTQEARAVAVARVPAEIRRAADDAIAWSAGPARWYRCTWSAERVLARPHHAVAVRYQLAMEPSESLVAWQLDTASAGFREEPAILFLALCVAEDDPREGMTLMLRDTPGNPTNVSSFLERHPPPQPFPTMERFAGRIDLRWDPAEGPPA
jgi:hypothetical protein